MNEEDITEWIDQYLDNELEGEEKEVFEERLQQDPAFRLEVESQKAVRKSLQDWGNNELKTRFRQFHARMPKQENNPSSLVTSNEVISSKKGKVRQLWIRPAVWTIAASFFLLLLAGTIWINRHTLFSNVRETELTALQVFQIPVNAPGGESIGYAGDGTITDSVMVQILTDGQYPFHYRFKDTLQIFSSATLLPGELRLEYHEQADTYVLLIQEKQYPIERGGNRVRELHQQ